MAAPWRNLLVNPPKRATIPAQMKFHHILAGFLSLALTHMATADVAADMAKAANALVASLDAKQKKQTLFPFKSDTRTYWHFIPAEMLKGGGRAGLQIKHMTGQQRELTHALL